MKIKIRTYVLAAVFVLFSVGAVAGLVNPFPVSITTNDDGSVSANGNMATARFSENEVEYIGCGTRTVDLGGGDTFIFGFCQAGDSDEAEAFCSPENPEVLQAIKSISSYSFLSFLASDVGDCLRVGVSTQSVYIPSGKVK